MYFDVENSSIDNYLTMSKVAVIPVAISDETIDIGNCTLFEYSTELLGTENKIEQWLYEEEITLKKESNPNEEEQLKGYLRKRTDGIIIFKKISGTIEVGKSYTSNESGLIKIRQSKGTEIKKEYIIVDKLKFETRKEEENNPYFNNYFIKNNSLGELIILKSDIPASGNLTLKFPGTATMETKLRNHSAFPVISVGNKENSYGVFSHKNPNESQGYSKRETPETITLDVQNSSGGTSTVKGQLFVIKPNKDPQDYFELDFSSDGYRALGKSHYSFVDKVEVEVGIKFTREELIKLETYPTITSISDGTINFIPAEKNHLEDTDKSLHEKFVLPSSKYGNAITENLTVRYENNTAVGGDINFTYIRELSNVNKEEIELESFKNMETVPLLELGKLTYTQTTAIDHGTGQDGQNYSFPVIALGKRESYPIGWILNEEEKARTELRTLYGLKYGQEQKTFFYPRLKNPIPTQKNENGQGENSANLYSQKGVSVSYSEEEYLAVGARANATKKLETIATDLSFKINNLENVDEILDYIRKIPNMNVTLYTDSSIYFINATYKNSNKIDYLDDISHKTTVVAVPYPTVTITKEPYRENKEHKINLLPGYAGELIKFSENGTINSSNGISYKANTDLTSFDLQSYKVFKGIHFSGEVNIYTDRNEFVGNMNLGISGVSTEQEFEIAGASTRVKVKFDEGGIFNIGLSKWKINMELPLRFEFKEPSGLIRKYYETKIKTPTTAEGYIDIEVGDRYNPSIEETIEIGDSMVFNRTVLNVTSSGEQLKSLLFSRNSNGAMITSTGTAQVFGDGISKVIEEAEKAENLVMDITDGISSPMEIKLKNGTRVRLEHVAGKLKVTPVFWVGAVTDSFTVKYEVRIGEYNFVGIFNFTIKTPGRFIATVGALDFGRVLRDSKEITRTSQIEIYSNYELDAEFDIDVNSVDYSLDTGTGGYLWLDEEKRLKVKNIRLGTAERESKVKTVIPLSGTIEDTDKVSAGMYEKTIQLIIHLK